MTVQTRKPRPHICRACGEEMWSPEAYRCECGPCTRGTQHLEQCGRCGVMSHRRGPIVTTTR